MTQLINTGSSVSGDGYGYAILRDSYASDAKFYVQLRVGSSRVVFSAGSYNSAHDIGRDFCHACHQWRVVQNRELAMAAGYAVLG